MATSPAKRVEPTRRRDPRARNIDGSSTAWTAIKNRDPEKHYVLVSVAAEEHGPDWYESIGYSVEVYGGEDGISLKGGRSTKDKGSPIEMRGHLLMSCPLETKERIEREGPDGDSGQLEADRVEKLLSLNRNKGSGRDTLRGIGIRGEDYIEFENQIGPLERVTLTI